MFWQGASGTVYQVMQSQDMAGWTNAPSGSNAVQQSRRRGLSQDVLQYQCPEPVGEALFYRTIIEP